MPLLQPRLGSIEEWKFLNNNNDEHPIHIHVNDFQVTYYLDPTRGIETGPEMWAVDNANVPAPVLGPEESVIQQGALSLRMKFDDFTGLFVMHCHRLNHEDNGLMMMVNVIPAVSTYAVAVPGSKGKAAQVKIYDGSGDKLVATVTPFEGFEGTPSVAMGDVNDDGVYDLVVGAGKDHAPEVVAYSGKAAGGKYAFETELARFEAFDSAARGGVSVAASQIDGSTADNIIVGSGAGVPSEVKVFRSDLPSQSGKAPSLFSTFAPYPDDSSGVSVASGFVDFATGRYSIVTAPGAGSAAQVKVFVFPLMPPIGQKTASAKSASAKSAGKTADMCPEDAGKPNLAAAFMPFGLDYKGGVSLGHGLARRNARRRREDRGRPARRPRPSEGVLQRLGAPGRPGDVLRPSRPQSHRRLRRDGELHAVRRRCRRDRGDDEHDARRQPAGERRLGEGQGRAGSQIRAGQALAASDQHVGQAARHGGLGCGLAAERAWRGLRPSRLSPACLMRARSSGASTSWKMLSVATSTSISCASCRAIKGLAPKSPVNSIISGKYRLPHSTGLPFRPWRTGTQIALVAVKAAIKALSTEASTSGMSPSRISAPSIPAGKRAQASPQRRAQAIGIVKIEDHGHTKPMKCRADFRSLIAGHHDDRLRAAAIRDGCNAAHHRLAADRFEKFIAGAHARGAACGKHDACDPHRLAPPLPRCIATISARMESAISAAPSAPISSPIGA